VTEGTKSFIEVSDFEEMMDQRERRDVYDASGLWGGKGRSQEEAVEFRSPIWGVL
jgi:hypothetical protein